MKRTSLCLCSLIVLVTLSVWMTDRRLRSQQPDSSNASGGHLTTSDSIEPAGSNGDATGAGAIEFGATESVSSRLNPTPADGQESTAPLVRATSQPDFKGATRRSATRARRSPQMTEASQGSQDEARPTSARALPPEHLASLIASAVEAEVIEEKDGPDDALNDVATSAINGAMVRLQDRISAATAADRQQIGSELLSAFRHAPADTKIELLAMAAELGVTSYTSLLLQLGLAATESEDVRVQAAFVAGDLAPDILKAFANDSSEALRDEVNAQLERR